MDLEGETACLGLAMVRLFALSSVCFPRSAEAISHFFSKYWPATGADKQPTFSLVTRHPEMSFARAKTDIALLLLVFHSFWLLSVVCWLERLMVGKIHGSKNSTTDRSKRPLALELSLEHGQLKPLLSLKCDQRYRIKSSSAIRNFEPARCLYRLSLCTPCPRQRGFHHSVEKL